MFDQRGDGDGSVNKIYFKSEVAVRDEDHGWIMWGGLSNTPNNNSGTVTLEYRLLLLKKNGGNWEIDKGFGWSSPSTGTEAEGSSNEVLDQLHVILPTGSWQITRAENGYSQRRI